MTSVAILSPGYPDSAGGVTAHTRRLVRNWSNSGHEIVVLGGPPEGVESTADHLLQTGAKLLLVQYVPFLYGRRGLSRFPERLVRLASNAGVSVTIFVHEAWVPPTRLPWVVLGPLQRRQLRRILRLTRAVVTPVPRWKGQLRPDTKILYVGSTLDDSIPDRSREKQIPAPVVFSPFASGLQWDWIVEATTNIAANPPLIIIGADAQQVRTHHSVGRWFRADWQCLGRLHAGDVLDHLARASLVLAPFGDGVTGRRTSLFATASTGARILCSHGHLHDEFFTSSPLYIANTIEEFVSQAVRLWTTPDQDHDRSRRIDWYREMLDPVRLDAQLLEVVLGGGD